MTLTCVYMRAPKNLTVLKMTIKQTFSLEQNSNVNLNFHVEVSDGLLQPHNTLIIFSVFIYLFIFSFHLGFFLDTLGDKNYFNNKKSYIFSILGPSCLKM